MDEHVGARVRHWRLKRGLSQRTLAGLSGFSQGYIAQIETGVAALDKRSSQMAIAAALQVAVADLTGQPYDPQTIEDTAARTAMPRLRAALLEVSLGGRDHPARTETQLRAAAADATTMHNDCRYDRLAPLLAELLPDLSAGRDRWRLRTLTWASYAATFTAKYLGYADLALLAAQCCRAAADNLDEPAWTGVAEFALLHALPLEANTLAARRADQIIAALAPHAGDPDAAQVYGMVHLTAAMRKAAHGHADDASAHLSEADSLAARLGEGNFAQMWFGPTNSAIWRVGVYTELGEGARLRRFPALDPAVLASRNRQATYYCDLGRGLAQTRHDDERALAALLRAETIAPQRVRLSPPVREAVGSMMRRARAKAGGGNLHTLAKRLGLL